MKASPQPLVISHKVNGRQVRRYRTNGRRMTVGSSRDADIRVLGDCAGIVCLIERHNGHWVVMDLGSQPDVRIAGKPFVEAVIGDLSTLQVGQHSLELNALRGRRDLFADVGNGADKNSANGELLTVVKCGGKIAEAGVNINSASWGPDAEVIKVPMPDVPVMPRESIRVDEEFKKPLLVTLLAFIAVLAISIGMPQTKEQAVRPADNIYTKMIYDSKILEQRRQQLVSDGVKSKQGTGNGNGTISEGAAGQANAVNKAVTSLRKSGLSSLISKIANRATRNMQLIAMMNDKAVNEGGTDHVFGSISGPSAAAASGKGMGGNAKGFKIAGIGTGGKGAGVGTYKNGTGLGTGAIGNGQVSIDDNETEVEGGLDKDVIAGIIKEHLGQVRYCYERQLSAQPDLYGKVKVKFIINAAGDVDTQSISQSTLKNAMVEECILRRIATWKFPKPRGGTRVIVSYPFLFKSVN